MLVSLQGSTPTNQRGASAPSIPTTRENAMKNLNPDFPEELKCQNPLQAKKGQYIYCCKTNTNLEVLEVFGVWFNSFTYLSVLGASGPYYYFDSFRDDKETLYAVERYEGGLELLNAKGELKGSYLLNRAFKPLGERL